MTTSKQTTLDLTLSLHLSGGDKAEDLLKKMMGYGYVLHHPWSNSTRPVTEARVAIDTDKDKWAVFDNLVMVHSSFLGNL